MSTTNLDRIIPPDAVAIAPDRLEFAFTIACLYQDAVTHNWAAQMGREMTRLAGKEWVQNTYYRVDDLSDCRILLDAIKTAVRANVIVVAVHAAEELPADLCVWIDAWVPRRRARAGALVALIGVAGQSGVQAVRTREYLRAVARRGQLDFVPHERKLPAEPGVISAHPIPELAGVSA